MRKVTARYWKDGKEFPVTGLFHQWAPAMEESIHGFGNYTVALVEDDTGQIRTCFPETVQFLEPPLPF